MYRNLPYQYQHVQMIGQGSPLALEALIQEMEQKQKKLLLHRRSVDLDFSTLAESPSHFNAEDDKLRAYNPDDRHREPFANYQHLDAEFIDNQESNGKDNLYSAEAAAGYSSDLYALTTTVGAAVFIATATYLLIHTIYDSYFSYNNDLHSFV